MYPIPYTYNAKLEHMVLPVHVGVEAVYTVTDEDFNNQLAELEEVGWRLVQIVPVQEADAPAVAILCRNRQASPRKVGWNGNE